LGVRPPGPKFRNFWRDTSFVYFDPLFLLHSVSAGDGSQGAKWRKVLSPYNPPKMGLENFGGVALFQFDPLGGALPLVRLYLITPLGPPMITFFKWKESAPIRGRCGCLKIFGIWHFGVLWPQLSSDHIQVFSICLGQSTLPTNGYKL